MKISILKNVFRETCHCTSNFRPEQITKMYSDIYNNEWGEAFLYLTRKKKVKEVEAIEELLKIAEVSRGYHYILI